MSVKKVILHIALTPISGSVIRLCQGLNQHTPYHARFLCLSSGKHDARQYQNDLNWDEHREKALALIKEADILQFHHFMHVASKANPFYINFIEEKKDDAAVIFHWHSGIDNIAALYNVDKLYLRHFPYPQFVVAQYHTRYFPSALPVPLIHECTNPSVLETLHLNKEKNEENKKVRVVFPASHKAKAYSNRWESKAFDLVSNTLYKLQKMGTCEVDILNNVSFKECQQRIAQADIVIDDMINGSFHTVTLEALSMGKVAICFMDSATEAVLKKLCNSALLPVVNVHYEHLAATIRFLSTHVDIRHEISQYSLRWYLEKYSAEKMLAIYVQHYEKVTENGFTEQPKASADALAAQEQSQSLSDFYNITLNDIKWRKHKRKYISYSIWMKSFIKDRLITSLKKTTNLRYFLAQLSEYSVRIPFCWNFLSKYKLSYYFFMRAYFREGLTVRDLDILYKNALSLHIQHQLMLISALLDVGKKTQAQSLVRQLSNNPVHRYHLSLSIAASAVQLGENNLFSDIFFSQNMNQFKAFLKDKTIAVVGNSPCEIGLGKGSKIDAHEVVMRFNNFHQHGNRFQEDYGRKVSVWVHSGWDDVEYSHALLDQVDYVLFLNKSRYMQWRCLPTILKIYETYPNKTVFASIEDIRQLSRFTKKGNISTGINVLSFLMLNKLTFSSYGFKLTDQAPGTRNYYFTTKTFIGTSHHWNNERKLLDKIFMSTQEQR